MRALLVSLFFWMIPFVAFAQQGGAPADDLPPGFRPVPGGEARAEAVDANLLVVIAYGAFFAALFGFVIYVVRSQSKLAKEIADLRRKLEHKR